MHLQTMWNIGSPYVNCVYVMDGNIVEWLVALLLKLKILWVRSVILR